MRAHLYAASLALIVAGVTIGLYVRGLLGCGLVAVGMAVAAITSPDSWEP